MIVSNYIQSITNLWLLWAEYEIFLLVDCLPIKSIDNVHTLKLFAIILHFLTASFDSLSLNFQVSVILIALFTLKIILIYTSCNKLYAYFL